MDGWNSAPYDQAVRDRIAEILPETTFTEHVVSVPGEDEPRVLVAEGSPLPDLATALSVGLNAVDNGTIHRESRGEMRVEVLAVAERRFAEVLGDGIAAIVAHQFTAPGTTLTPQVLVRDLFTADGVTTPHAVLIVPYVFQVDPVAVGDDLVSYLQAIPVTEAEFGLAHARGAAVFLGRIADSEEVNLLDLSRPSTVSDEEAAAAGEGVGFGVQSEDERGESIMVQTAGQLMGEQGQVATFRDLPGVEGVEPMAVFADEWPVEGMMMAFTASMNRVDTGDETDEGLPVRREAVVHVQTPWRDRVLQGLAGLYQRLAHNETVPDFEELVMHAFPRELDGEMITTPHALVVEPQFFQFPPLDLPDRQIHIMQFIPITDDEFMYATSNGVEALVAKLVETEVPIAELDRRSAV